MRKQQGGHPPVPRHIFSPPVVVVAIDSMGPTRREIG